MRRLVFAACLFTACAPAFSAPTTGEPSVTPGASVGSASPATPTARAALSAAPSPTSAAPSPSYTPEPLTRMELKVIGALATLGVAAQRAQHPYEDSASIWANFGTGSHFFVHVAPTSMLSREASFAVLEERQIEGIRVRHAEYEGGSTHHRFECSGITYKVSGVVPPGSRDMYAFVARFISPLNCAA